MKKILLLLISIISIKSFAVRDTIKLNLNENITGSYNTLKSGDQLLLSINSLNHIELSKWYMDINPYYNLGYIQKVMSANELSTKEDIGTHWNRFSAFIATQYNSSFIRSIDHDQWYGVGVGRKFNINKKISTSLSYCYQYEFRKYKDKSNEEIQRSSIRAKIGINYTNFNLSFEYYFAPSTNTMNDLNIFGSSTLTLFPNKPINFIIQNIYNYISTDRVKIIQNTTIGLRVKINK